MNLMLSSQLHCQHFGVRDSLTYNRNAINAYFDGAFCYTLLSGMTVLCLYWHGQLVDMVMHIPGQELNGRLGR